MRVWQSWLWGGTGHVITMHFCQLRSGMANIVGVLNGQGCKANSQLPGHVDMKLGRV